MRRPLFRAAAVLAALALAACGGDGGGKPTPVDPDPVPGQLTATLATPSADDRALMLTITGPEAVTGVTAAGAGYAVFARPADATTVRVAVFGNIAAGALVRFSVPDVNRAAAYSVSVVEAADPANALRASLAGYAVTVAR